MFALHVVIKIRTCYRTADISEAESREALLEFVNTKTCWGKGAVEKMDMTNIAPCNALHVSRATLHTCI